VREIHHEHGCDEVAPVIFRSSGPTCAEVQGLVTQGEMSMLQAFNAGLTDAIGIAISPIPIVAIILVLISTRARINAPLLTIGWLVGLLLTTSIGFYLVSGSSSRSASSGPSDLSLAIELAFGFLFAFLAIWEFHKRPRHGAAAPEPKFFSTLNDMPFYVAFGLGLVLAIANVKNLPLALTAGAAMAGTGATGVTGVAAIVVFALIGSVSLIVPTVVVLLLGQRVEAQLTDVKNWLMRHKTAIMVTLFTLLAAKAISGGLALFT
jgi:hypothetical protein